MQQTLTGHKVLHLTLNKKWFDMIASGEKKEEYREIKMYWWNRLVQCGECYPTSGIRIDELLPPQYWKMIMPKNFDIVSANNGYQKDCPNIKWKHEGIRIGEGKSEWGAEPGKQYFILEIGELIK